MKSKNISLLLSLMLIVSPVSDVRAYVADAVNSGTLQTSENVSEETFTVEFLDFDGNVINTQKIKKGEPIDYSAPDTDSLKFNVDTFTQRMFSEWDIHPETVTADTKIQALYTEAVISLESTPQKTVYSLDDIVLDTSGFKVTITISTQTTNFDGDGNRIIDTQVTDISSTCTFSPNNVQEVFKSADSAEIKIYPISSSVPVGSYTITLDFLRGDVNFDGVIDSSDASAVIHHYASYSLGVDDGFSDKEKRAGDFNRDGVVDACDASDILSYYAEISSGQI